MTAFAQPNYNNSSGSGNNTLRKIGAGAAILFLAAGVYATIADAGTAVAANPQGAVPAAAKRSIYDIIKSDPTDYKTLGADIDEAQMIKTYREDGPYTVFAPDETAFAKLSAAQIGSFTGDANRPKLQALLSFHTVKGRYSINDLKALPDGTKLVTLAGTVLTINTTGGVLAVNGVPVVESDQVATNGYVHEIQTVLLPADMVDTSTTAPVTPATTDTTTPATTPPADNTTPPPATVPPPATPATPAPTTQMRVPAADNASTSVVGASNGSAASVSDTASPAVDAETGNTAPAASANP
jgi:uncharacterized surface protein with fasciclin (FAS1) repeats